MSTLQIRNETYKAIKPDTKNLAERIYLYLSKQTRPMTRNEIAEKLGVDPVSVRARITEMMPNKDGYIRYPKYELELAYPVTYINENGRTISTGTYHCKIVDLFS